jgi:hypothetical protein
LDQTDFQVMPNLVIFKDIGFRLHYHILEYWNIVGLFSVEKQFLLTLKKTKISRTVGLNSAWVTAENTFI